MSDQELLAQIAQVAGAINKHINTPAVRGFQGYHGYNQSMRGGYPAQGRGRGRGAHTPVGAFNRPLTLNNTSAAPRPSYPRPVPAPTPTPTVIPARPATSAPYFPKASSTVLQPSFRPPAASRHLTLVNTNKNTPNGPSSQSPATGHNTPISPISPSTPVPEPPAAPTQQWIQIKRKNMSLMNESTFKKTMVAKQKSIQASKESRLKLLQAKRANRLRKGIVTVGGSEYTKSRDGRKLVMHDNKPVVINGVEFEMDRRGNKLVRKAVAGAISKLEAPTIKAGLGTTPSTAATTPKQFSMGGVYYVRTRNGNLVRATLVKDQLLRARQEKANKRQRKARPFCRNFTRFGRCHRDYLCPLVHSRDHLAICKRFLRGICSHTASTCLLSHVPNPHTTPPCQHFQRAACTKENCPYPHIKKNPQAPICRPFATEGWCNDGNACKDRHVWICPDFGTPTGCKRKCGLAHLENGGLKAKRTPEEVEKSRQEWQKAIAAGEVVGGKRKAGPQLQPPGSRYWEKPNDTDDGSASDQFDENFIPLNFDEVGAEEDEDVLMDENDILEEDVEDISSDGVATDDDEGEDDESGDDGAADRSELEDTRGNLRAIEVDAFDSDQDQDEDLAQQELDEYYAAQDLEEL